MIQDPVKQGQEPKTINVDDLLLGPADDPIGSIMSGIETDLANRATGMKWLGYQGLAALKSFGDAYHNLAQFGPAGQIQRMLPEEMRNQGVLGDIEGAYQGVRALMGNTPDLNLTWNQRADADIDEKLWNDRVIGDTAGYLASFVTGPGSAVGQGGAAAASKVAGPMGQWAQRALAKTATKGVAGLDDATKVALANGSSNFWKILAKDKGWKEAASARQIVSAWAGRNVDDAISATAANVLQSYGLAPDERRNEEALFSLITPVSLPLARLGERLSVNLAGFRMKPDTQAKIALLSDEIQRGTIAPREAQKLIRELDDAPMVRRAIAEAVSSTFEAAAFMPFSAQNWRDFGAMMDGDSEAAQRLQNVFLGSAIGIAVGKYGVPMEDAPFFKRVRPDLNTLQTFAEAEAARQEFEKSQQPKTAAPQEPVAAAPVTPDQPQPVQGPDTAKAEREQAVARLQQRTQKILENIGWSERESVPLMRSGWEPIRGEAQQTLGDDGSVYLQFGRDDRIRLEQKDGQVEVTLDPRTLDLLEQAGHRVDREVLSPALAKVRGDQARQTLEKLTLLGMHRRLRAANRFENLGFTEVADGVWKDPDTSQYYVASLDGGTNSKKALDSSWDGRESDLPLPRPQDPIYRSGYLDSWNGWFDSKRAVAPDPLTDALFGEAMKMAENGVGPGAQNLRVLMESVPPAVRDALTGPNVDRFLAMQFVDVALGGSVQRAMNEMASMATLRNVDRGTQELDPATGQVLGPELQPAAETQTLVAPRRNIPEAVEAPERPVPEQPAPVDPELGQRGTGWLRNKPPEPPPEGGTPAEPTPPAPPQQPQTVADMLDRVNGARKGEEQMGGGIEMAAGSGNPFAGVRKTKEQRARERAQEYSRGRAEKAVDFYFENYPQTISKLAGSRTETDLAREAMSLDRTYKADVQPLEDAARKVVAKNRSEMTGTRLDTEYANWAYNPARTAVEQGPWSAGSKAVADAFDAVRRRLWILNREAGVLRDTPTGPEPMQGEGGRVLPRLRGKDYDTVFRSDKLLPELARQIYEHPDNPQARREFKSADELREKILQPMADLAGQGDSTVVQAALEKFRFFNKLPDLWTWGNKQYELFESKPLELLARMSAGQTTRAAIVKSFGPDNATPEIRERLGITKPGVTKTLNDLIQKLSQRGADAASWVDSTKRWFEQIQTQRPEHTAFSRAMNDFIRYGRSAETFLSWRYDIADMFNTLGLVGTRRFLKTMARSGKMWLSSPKRFVQHAEMTGSMISRMGELAVSEAVGAKNRFLDALTWLGNQSERLKASGQTVMAETMIESWKKGYGESLDAAMLTDVLDMPPAVAGALTSGSATPAQERQFIHEWVQATTGQKRVAEGSAAGANATLNAAFDYQRFFRSRIPLIAKTAKILAKGWQDPKTRGNAIVRAIEQLAGVTLASQIGIALGAAISQWTKDDESLKMWWKTLSESPEGMIKTLAQGYRATVLGGPTENVVRSLENPLDLRTATSWNRLTKTLYAAGVAAHTPGAAEKVWSFAKQAPLIPAGSYIEGVANMLTAGEINSEADHLAVSAFRRREGMAPHSPSLPSKEAEFYRSLKEIRKVIEQHPADPEAAFRAATEHMQKAIGVESRGELRAAISSMKQLTGFDVPQLDKLRKMLGDTDRFANMVTWDKTIDEIARQVGKLDDPNSGTDLQKEVEAATNLAKEGMTGSFKRAYQQVMDDAVKQYRSGGGLSEDIRFLAESIAPFPEAVQEFAPQQKGRKPSTSPVYNSMRLQRTMIERVQSRAKAEIKAEAEAARRTNQ